MLRRRRPGGLPYPLVNLGAVYSDTTPPTPVGAEYQYGSHEASIKGSKAAGYGVTFGAFAALMSVAVLQHKGHFTGTVSQDPGYQQSFVTQASPALFVTTQSPVIKSILGQGQENQTQQGSAVYSLEQAQRPLFETILTFPQESQEIRPSAVYGMTAATGLQTPRMLPWDQTWPQENQQQVSPVTFSFPPPTAQAAVPYLGPAIQTQAEWPQVTPSLVRTTNIALELAPPPLRGAIVTQAEQPLPAPSLVIPATGALPLQSPIIRPAISTVAEQPLPAPSWSLVNTELIPSFVAGTPPTTTWTQTWPQDQGLYEINASLVLVPTAAQLPSVIPPPPVPPAEVTGSVPGFVKGDIGKKKRKKSGPVTREGQVFGEEYPVSPFATSQADLKAAAESEQTQADKLRRAAIMALMKELI